MNAAIANTAYQRHVRSPLAGDATIQAFHGSRVSRVSTPNSELLNGLGPRFADLIRLPTGWDGYLGQPLPYQTASFAISLLDQFFTPGMPLPSVVPGGDGSVQLEWHIYGFDLEIDIVKPYEVRANRYNLATSQSEEEEFNSDYTLLGQWIADLGRAAQLGASVAA